MVEILITLFYCKLLYANVRSNKMLKKLMYLLTLLFTTKRGERLVEIVIFFMLMYIAISCNVFLCSYGIMKAD